MDWLHNSFMSYKTSEVFPLKQRSLKYSARVEIWSLWKPLIVFSSCTEVQKIMWDQSRNNI